MVSTGELFLKNGGGIGGGKLQNRQRKLRPPQNGPTKLNALVKRTSNLEIFTTVLIPTKSTGGLGRESEKYIQSVYVCVCVFVNRKKKER